MDATCQHKSQSLPLHAYKFKLWSLAHRVGEWVPVKKKATSRSTDRLELTHVYLTIAPWYDIYTNKVASPCSICLQPIQWGLGCKRSLAMTRFSRGSPLSMRAFHCSFRQHFPAGGHCLHAIDIKPRQLTKGKGLAPAHITTTVVLGPRNASHKSIKCFLNPP